jgi:hypothetical protein
MQEARGSNPLSSTFPQVKRILRSSEMTFECLQPSKSPIVYDLPPLKSMQVRMMLCCGDTAVAPSSLSDSQTDCQSVIRSAVFCPSGQLPGAAVLRYVQSTWTISRVGWWRYRSIICCLASVGICMALRADRPLWRVSRGRWHLVPGSLGHRPALARAAARRGHRPRALSDRPGPGCRRDQAHRRHVRERDRGPRPTAAILAGSRVASEDSFVPLGHAAKTMLPSAPSIAAAARRNTSPGSRRTSITVDPGPLRQRQGVQGVSNRSKVFRIALRFAELAWGQNLPVVSLYSTWKTALPAERNGSSLKHSLNCWHCSLMV